MTNAYQYINYLKETQEIVMPNEFSIEDDFIKPIETNYFNIFVSSFEKGFDYFGYDLIDSRDEYLETIKEECFKFNINFLSLPLIWQEIVILIYLALQLHKYVDNNSRVVALGESPLKLVFIQQILNFQPELTNILKENGMATNVKYSYFPISSLSTYTIQILNRKKNSDIFNIEVDFNLDVFIENIIEISQNMNDQIISHFILFQLDPLTIIKNNKPIYFQDRAETYMSLITLMCFYDGMCDKQKISLQQRHLLYEKLYFITFDYKENKVIEKNQIIINRINNFLYRLITKKTDIIAQDKFHFIQQNSIKKRFPKKISKVFY